MTTLTITPDVAKKKLKLAGVVASGEKVAVTVVGFGQASTANLRLRAMAGSVAVGVFPLEDEDEWTVSGADLTCTLNLATEQAERFCKLGSGVCFLLEDTSVPQLYGAGDFSLRPWIKLAGVDVPVNLDNYKVRISCLEGRLKNHIERTDNPHGVTKSQVGLGNVNNTSDMDKPVSTAQNAAIAALRTAMTEADDALRARIDEKYEKPSGGIPKTDLSSAVQTSLDKADTVTLKVSKSAFDSLLGLTLPDTSTQKEIRVMVQTILGVLKNAAVCLALAFALPAFGIDADTAWEDVPPQGKVRDIVEQFSPPADFSTNNAELVETIETKAPAPGNYAAVSNAAMNAASREALAAKQDKLPYPTNAIPQGTVSGLSTALAGKADKVSGGTEGNLAEIGAYGTLVDSGNSLRELASAASLAPAFVPYNVYEVGDLCTSFDNDQHHKGTWLYKCILATDGFLPPEINPTHWALATVEDMLAALRTALAGKGDKTDIDDLDGRLDNAETNIEHIVDTELPDLREAIPTTAAEVHAYPDASGQQLAQQVAAIGAHVNGEDAKVMVTNYNSSTHLPEAEFHINVSNNWLVVWREMTRWYWFLGDVFDPHTNAVARALANKAEKEYAFFDGVTGEPAPDGFFWISQPRVAICAGAAYQRYVDTAGEVWVLESNGMVADINGTTNGYFRISDDKGNVQFEIVKGDSRTVTAAAGAMTRSSVMGVTHWHTTYMVTNAVSAPKAMFCRDIANPEWYAQDDPGCPCNVDWTHPSERIYVCEWWTQGDEPKMFMRSQYGQGSESRIVQNAPVEMQTIVIGGVKGTLGTATINGITVLTFTPGTP